MNAFPAYVSVARKFASPQPSRRLDRLALLLAFALASVTVLVGLHTGLQKVDVDEAVYRHTLRQMQQGDGYYNAMRDALTEKEGSPPSSLRSVRPPTLFVILRWFPEASWRWLVGIVYLAILLAAGYLGREYGRFGALIACGLVGVWLIGASPFLFLHAELWGLPFFLTGLLAVRRKREGRAALLFATATAFRELFGLGLLIGLVAAHRRRPWAIAALTTAALVALHAVLAHPVLSSSGREAAFGKEARTAGFVLTALSPGNRPFAWVLGILGLTLGIAGLIRARRTDPAATVLIPFVLVMIATTVLVTRVYWNLTWGPALAAFVPAALGRRTTSSAPPLPAPDVARSVFGADSLASPALSTSRGHP